MRHVLIPLCLSLFWSAALAADFDAIHHDLDAKADPATSKLEVVDRMSVPNSLLDDEVHLGLNTELEIKSLTPGIEFEVIAESIEAEDGGMDRDDAGIPSPIRINKYRVIGGDRSGDLELKVEIKGTINEPIEQVGEEYARGFSTSPGLIEERGVYLAGSTYWLPQIDEHLMTYEMTVSLPQGWRSIGQGTRLSAIEEAGRHIDTWSVTTPTEEVHLIGAQFTEYSFDVGAVKAMAFLRKPDDNLAKRYLETTAQYLEMYRNMLGPYPYTKFALVENFWETGFGMPSFTLLGEQVIRFPFILHSSYPHELLHNWWGNGVYVDFPTGNWCEGLTAYMADHLVAEQRGQGADYRRSILQRYTDYVKDDNDFPLSEFISRYSAATEAVGYGKSAMFWNMLRTRVGDAAFIEGFRLFYERNKFERASYDDIRAAFEDHTGDDLGAFFEQWVTLKGAPSLALQNVDVKEAGGGYALSFDLTQQQSAPAFNLTIPVAIYSNEGVTVETIDMKDASQSYELELESKPLRVEVDPAFDIFRRLDVMETPPSLSKAFGSDHTLIVLPAAADPQILKRYEQLAEIWTDGDKIEVVRDNEIDALPADRAIWILGDDNAFGSIVTQALSKYDASADAEFIQFGGTRLDKSNHSAVVALRHPSNSEQVIVWLTASHDGVVPRLASVLTHYGKYSYLGFQGEEAKNVASGEWPVLDSPLIAQLSDEMPTAELDQRPALATLDPVFSAERLKAHVDYLASDDLEGRGVGTAGLDTAADFLAQKFEEFGLQPGGDDGTYFQSFSVKGENDEDVTVKNVVGVIAGAKPDYDGQSVVISAHYDHLGRGWPDARQGFEGQIHNGADDNASGTAVLIELAEVMAQATAPDRSIVFAAFSAEEAGLLGAKHYAANAGVYPIDQTIANLNMDTVGRLGDKKVMIFGGPSSDDWSVLFANAAAATGIDVELASSNLSASDNAAFVDASVPAVQIFSGANEDYHRPSDTADKIDPAGMVKIATLVREAADVLAARKDRMHFRAIERTARPEGSRQRRVSTGTMPDFTFAGPGIKVQSVAENSPAAAAGLQAGDVITGLGEDDVADLAGFAQILGQFEPGDQVQVRYTRNGDELTGDMTLAAR